MTGGGNTSLKDFMFHEASCSAIQIIKRMNTNNESFAKVMTSIFDEWAARQSDNKNVIKRKAFIEMVSEGL